MTIHPLAGKPAPKELLVDVDKLRKEYYTRKPDITDSAERVSFGTSGHRGSSLRGAFNEAHVLAITQAICDYRSSQGITGPLFIGKDTHALSEPAFMTALEVLAANGVEAMIDRDDGYTPTPAVSHAILTHNRGRTSGLRGRHRHHAVAQSAGRRRLQIQPAARRTGGYRRHALDRRQGQPAAVERVSKSVARIAYERARRAATTHAYDYVGSYVSDLGSVVDMEVIRGARLKIGVDPLGGAERGVLARRSSNVTASTWRW